jgi:carbamoyl-phosphate synthase large subunit
LADGFSIRRVATEKRVPCYTSLDTFKAAMEASTNGDQSYSVQPLREYLTEYKG